MALTPITLDIGPTTVTTTQVGGACDRDRPLLLGHPGAAQAVQEISVSCEGRLLLHCR
jgi:hypothetical protein